MNAPRSLEPQPQQRQAEKGQSEASVRCGAAAQGPLQGSGGVGGGGGWAGAVWRQPADLRPTALCFKCFQMHLV